MNAPQNSVDKQENKTLNVEEANKNGTIEDPVLEDSKNI